MNCPEHLIRKVSNENLMVTAIWQKRNKREGGFCFNHSGTSASKDIKQ
jgi:hypothetical protein